MRTAAIQVDTLPLDTKEPHRRRRVVRAFAIAATTGDAGRFRAAMDSLDWPGAWADAFEQIAHLPSGMVAPELQRVFVEAWHRAGVWSRQHPNGIHGAVTRDCGTQCGLLVAAMKVLLPSYAPVTPVAALYRGQSLDQHQRGSYGAFWTPFPSIAEWFARLRGMACADPQAVLVAYNPRTAIVGQIDDDEIVIDPAQLEDVEVVMTTIPYAAGEEAIQDLRITSRLERVPSGYDADAVTAWRGSPIAAKQCQI